MVIGPGGVFTINAKHHPDAAIWVYGETFFVHGREKPCIAKARREAAKAAGLLSKACGRPIAVLGMVVPVAVGDLTVKRAPHDIAVIGHDLLRSWLADRPVVLSDEEVRTLYAVARRADTWAAPRTPRQRSD